MPIRAQSSDGAIHEFPDGTKPDIVDRAMKTYAQQNVSRETPVQPAGGFSGWLSRITDIPSDVAGVFSEGAKSVGEAYKRGQAGKADWQAANPLERARASQDPRKAAELVGGVAGMAGAAPLGAMRSMVARALAGSQPEEKRPFAAMSPSERGLASARRPFEAKGTPEEQLRSAEQVTSLVTPGFGVVPYAKLARGAGLTKGKMIADAPSTQAIFDAGTQAYEAAKKIPVAAPTHETSLLANNIVQKLNDAAIYKENPAAGDVFRHLDRLHGWGRTHLPSSELFALEKSFSALAQRTTDRGAQQAAQTARQDILDYLKKYPQLRDLIKVGDANWRVASMSREVTEAAEKGQMRAAASGRGANIDNALRQKIRALYDNKRLYKTDEERKIMQEIIGADNSPASKANIARSISKSSGPLRYLGLGAAAALAGGHKSGHLLLGAIQMLAENVANRATLGKVEKLDEMVRRNAPAAGPARLPQRTPAGGPGKVRAIASGAQSQYGGTE